MGPQSVFSNRGALRQATSAINAPFFLIAYHATCIYACTHARTHARTHAPYRVP